jgi:hypothetical protein
LESHILGESLCLMRACYRYEAKNGDAGGLLVKHLSRKKHITYLEVIPCSEESISGNYQNGVC